MLTGAGIGVTSFIAGFGLGIAYAYAQVRRYLKTKIMREESGR